MKPILFSESSTTFTTNGIGRLTDAITCTVTEERNGIYELEMDYPTSGQHYSDIGQRKIIVAQPSVDTSLQPFRIYKVTKPLNGRVKIYAQHLSYDLSKNVAMPFSVSASASACASALAGLKTNAVEDCPFTFETDVTTNAPYLQKIPATIRSRLGGVEGSILDQFGGEYEFDVYKVKFLRQRGSDKGVTLRYGKNITDINQEENIANTITGVVPFWKNTDGSTVVTLTEKVVYSSHASQYSQHLTSVLDLTDQFEEQPTESALRTKAQVYVNKSDFGVPKVSVDVSFVDLRGTEGYDDAIELETVQLCDTVSVQFVPLGIDTKAEVVKCEYDVLAERYNKITIGSIRSSLAATINDQNNSMMEMIERKSSDIGQAIDEATKWLTSAGGWVIAIKNTDGTWKELVFSNNIDPYNANAKILRINNNGIGFSQGGMNGTFTNAWTIDGHLIADFIYGGTLTLGGAENVNGSLRIMNASNQQIGKWDKDGISASNGSFTGTISGSNISGSNISGGSINGTTISWGTTTRFAKMYWKDITAAVGALQIETSLNQFGYNDQIIIKSLSVNVDGQMTVIGELRVNSNLYLTGALIGGDFIFRYSANADEFITMFILGTSGIVLEHGATGKYVAWQGSSDIKAKKDIKDLNHSFTREFFEKIRPVSFVYKNDEKKKTNYGLIAQELEEVFKDLGQDTDIVGELSNKTKYIDYPRLIGICLDAIKDLYKRVEILEKGSTK